MRQPERGGRRRPIRNAANSRNALASGFRNSREPGAIAQCQRLWSKSATFTLPRRICGQHNDFTLPLGIGLYTSSKSEWSHASLSGMSLVFQLETVAIQTLFFHRNVASATFRWKNPQEGMRSG